MPSTTEEFVGEAGAIGRHDQDLRSTVTFITDDNEPAPAASAVPAPLLVRLAKQQVVGVEDAIRLVKRGPVASPGVQPAGNSLYSLLYRGGGFTHDGKVLPRAFGQQPLLLAAAAEAVCVPDSNIWKKPANDFERMQAMVQILTELQRSRVMAAQMNLQSLGSQERQAHRRSMRPMSDPVAISRQAAALDTRGHSASVPGGSRKTGQCSFEQSSINP